MKYPPGQALRHGAPCFRQVRELGRRQTSHVIGTERDCAACRRYREHLGVSHEQALAIRAEGDQPAVGNTPHRAT